LRRLLAVALLLGLTGSVTESVVEASSEGTAHHDRVTDAAVHHDAQQLGGDHGHEDVSAPGPRQHQHGTATDHCAHVHGVGIVASFEFTVATRLSQLRFVEPAGTGRSFIAALRQPPRA
jgi:hypothetical protein